MDNIFNFDFGFGAEGEGQLNMNDLFGITSEENSKEKTGTTKKATTKKATAKKDEDVSMDGPVTVIGQNFKYVYGEEGKKYGEKHTLSEVEKIYPEIGTSNIYRIADESILIIGSNTGASSLKNSAVFNENTQKVTVCFGDLKAEFEPSDFAGKDADEICLEDVSNKFEEINPAFKGATYQISGNIITINMTQAAPIKDDAEVLKLFNEGGVKELKFSEIKEDFAIDGAEIVLHKTSDTYFLSYKTDKRISYKTSAANSKKTVAEAKVKVNLPVKLSIPLISENFELTSGHFSGKEKVSCDDIVDLLKQRFSIFGNSSRKYNLEAFKDQETGEQRAVLEVISGKKG